MKEVVCHQISHSYDGVRNAVNHLSLSIKAGEVMALIGPNGAGKSTTMSILAGLISPTAGTCEIRGLSSAQEMPIIRTFLGMCPQHNVLFPKLTVDDHMRCFAVLKGAVFGDLTAVVDEALREVGLFDKKDAIATTLSGGQKRKLSLAIAMLGGSSVVFLDEPTSGMDPYVSHPIFFCGLVFVVLTCKHKAHFHKTRTKRIVDVCVFDLIVLIRA